MESHGVYSYISSLSHSILMLRLMLLSLSIVWSFFTAKHDSIELLSLFTHSRQIWDIMAPVSAHSSCFLEAPLWERIVVEDFWGLKWFCDSKEMPALDMLWMALLGNVQMGSLKVHKLELRMNAVSADLPVWWCFFFFEKSLNSFNF